MINAWMNEWKIQTLKCTILKLTWQVPSVLFVQVCNEASAACGSSAGKKKILLKLKYNSLKTSKF